MKDKARAFGARCPLVAGTMIVVGVLLVPWETVDGWPSWFTLAGLVLMGVGGLCLTGEDE